MSERALNYTHDIFLQGVAAQKPGYEMTSTSMFRQQQNYFATVIQRAFRFHNGGLAEAE